MKNELQHLIASVHQIQAMDISCYDESFLAKTLEKRLSETSIPSLSSYLEYLSLSREEAEALIRSLDVNYSDFFRNPLVFDLLEYFILPRIMDEKSGQVRIWSAGCASGQEPYSIAMILDDFACQSGKLMHSRIFATDKTESDLEFARRGIYSDEAVQNIRLRHIRKYFTRSGETYVILARLKEVIDFSAHDLLHSPFSSPPSSIYGDFDLIFCCNLLYYYRPEVQQIILSQIGRTLTPNGFLVTGETEKAIVEKNGGYIAVAPPITVFRKNASHG